MRRYALRDDQWDRVKDILPGREGTVGVTARDNRLFVEAVLYRYRAGIPSDHLKSTLSFLSRSNGKSLINEALNSVCCKKR